MQPVVNICGWALGLDVLFCPVPTSLILYLALGLFSLRSCCRVLGFHVGLRAVQPYPCFAVDAAGVSIPSLSDVF